MEDSCSHRIEASPNCDILRSRRLSEHYPLPGVDAVMMIILTWTL